MYVHMYIYCAYIKCFEFWRRCFIGNVRDDHYGNVGQQAVHVLSKCGPTKHERNEFVVHCLKCQHAKLSKVESALGYQAPPSGHQCCLMTYCEGAVIMVSRWNVTRPNANRPNVTFTISVPMSPGLMSPRPNVNFSNVTRLNIAYGTMSPVPNVAYVVYNTGPDSPLLGPWFKPLGVPRIKAVEPNWYMLWPNFDPRDP
jgi:hypothetical protein